MLPPHAQGRNGVLYEPSSSGRESSHLSLGKFEPTHVGCYEREWGHGPDACARANGGSPRRCAHCAGLGTDARLFAFPPFLNRFLCRECATTALSICFSRNKSG